MLTSLQTEKILRATGASSIIKATKVQSLWSGYGMIYRVNLQQGVTSSVIVKAVHFRDPGSQPRGWNTDFSHQRKLHSYQVEACWYRDWAGQTDETCRVAQSLFVENPPTSQHHDVIGDREAVGPGEEGFLFILEDLDVTGFPRRCQHLTLPTVRVGLGWLANFHAKFLHQVSVDENPSAGTTNGLWPEGTYWHLATRPDELAAMPHSHPLYLAAQLLDQKLRAARHRTLVHGDAKVANLCFSQDLTQVAAVDFQYVGGGCGMKDFAYFLGSCLDETECEQHAFGLLDDYFAMLRVAIKREKISIDPDILETEWQELFPVAWADFNRFLLGWCPGHQKLHRFSQAMTELALAQIEKTV